MKCSNCEEEIENSVVFRYIRLKKKEPVKCPSCGKKLSAKSIYSYAGRVGGSVTSEKKWKSSRENGLLGGRPRKKKKN